MTLNLSKPGSEITARTETVIVRVEQDHNIDGSVSLTIHTAEWLTLPDGSKREIGQWTRHRAIYPDVETMTQLTAIAWGKSLDEAEKALSDYGAILNAALSALIARDTQTKS